MRDREEAKPEGDFNGREGMLLSSTWNEYEYECKTREKHIGDFV
jgi:hypothetical protein